MSNKIEHPFNGLTEMEIYELGRQAGRAEAAEAQEAATGDDAMDGDENATGSYAVASFSGKENE